MGYGSAEGHDWAVSTGFQLYGSPIAVIAIQRSLLSVVGAAKELRTVPWLTGSPLAEVEEMRLHNLLPATRSERARSPEHFDPRSGGTPDNPPEPYEPRYALTRYPQVAVEHEDPSQALSDLVDHLVRRAVITIRAGDEVASYLLEAVPVPVFGSPPQALRSVGTVLQNMAPGAAIILPSAPDIPSATHLIVAGAATSLWITFGKPTLRVTGAAYQRWLQRRLNVTVADLKKYGGQG